MLSQFSLSWFKYEGIRQLRRFLAKDFNLASGAKIKM